MDSKNIRQWARQEDFLTELYYYLKRTLTKEQIDSLKMSSFAPYVDIENNKYVFDNEPSRNQGFMYFRQPNGQGIVLEYRDEQWHTSNFERVTMINELFETEKEKYLYMDGFSVAYSETREQRENITLSSFALVEILKNDPIYLANEKEKERQKAEKETAFYEWIDKAHKITHFELIHATVSSTQSEYLTLYEKDGVYKILESVSGCFDSSMSEFNLNHLNHLLTKNYTQETLENLQHIYTLINEKPILESKIKAFRKPNGEIEESKKNKI
jgi:hypothetical protein